MIYKLRANRHQYMNAYIPADSIQDTFGSIFAINKEAWTDFWQPLELTFVDESDKGGVAFVPDITVWGTTNNLILNQKVYDEIGSELKNYGEMLPLTCEGNAWWVLHTTKKVEMDCVNTQVSVREIDDFEDVVVKKMEFFEEKLADNLIFLTPYTDFKNVYATERFKTLIESHGFNGLVWSEDLVSLF